MPITRRELIRAAIRAACYGLPLGGLALALSQGTVASVRAQSGHGPLARVAIGHRQDAVDYPTAVPFDPAEEYPEYPHGPTAVEAGPNHAYALVREALAVWAPERAGTPEWNPLGDVVRPGQTVLLKPNLVTPRVDDSTTHIAVVRAVIDYAYRATGPSGRILVGEGTAAASDWSSVLVNTGLTRTVDHLRERYGVPVATVDLNNAPASTPTIDLGQWSALAGQNRVWLNLRGGAGLQFPSRGAGRYILHPAILEADVVIAMPKLKVHRATGITVAMKNMIGMIPALTGTKDFPHYSSVERPGGEAAIFGRNDTIWRIVVDIHRAMLHADAAGRLHDNRQRRYLAIVDGLRAGGTNMFDPTSHPLGTVIIADQPITADAVAARVMGYDARKIAALSRAAEFDPTLGPLTPDRVEVRQSSVLASLADAYTAATVVPVDVGTVSWRGRIELNDFGRPQLGDLQVDPATGRLQVRARSAVGVAAVHALGGSGLEMLRLVDGDEHNGLWSTDGLTLAGAVVARDHVFNDARQVISATQSYI